MEREFIICCPCCLNTKLEKDEAYINETGEDKFICPECGEDFTLAQAQYL